MYIFLMTNGLFYTLKDRVEMGLSLGSVNVGIIQNVISKVKEKQSTHLIILKKGTTKMLLLRVIYLASHLRGKERRKRSITLPRK